MPASDKALRYTAKAAKGTLLVAGWTAKATYRVSAAAARSIRQEVQTRQWEAARAKEALPAPASSTKFASLGKNARPIGPAPSGVRIDDFAKTSAGHLECTIRSSTPGGVFTAAHRYSDFVRLQGELAPAHSAPLPGKLPFGTHTKAKLRKRADALEAWLNGAVQNPDVSNHPALHAFLGLRMLAVNL